MHHAPAGPPLFSRVAGLLTRVRFRVTALLAPLVMVIGVLRRTRVLPVALTGLALGAFALTVPLAPYDDGSRSTAALSSTSGDGQGLVPATGDGWTQDGAPAAPSPSAAGSSSQASGAGSPSSESVASQEPSEASAPEDSAPATRATASGASTESSTASSSAPTSSSESSPASSSSSVASSPEPSSSAPSEPSPSATPAADAGDAVPTADLVLAAVNAARTDAACPALTADIALAALAAEHAAAMSDGGSPLDPGSQVAVIATGSDAGAVVDGGLSDADDRAALLDCALTIAGVGVSDGYWTLLAA